MPGLFAVEVKKRIDVTEIDEEDRKRITRLLYHPSPGLSKESGLRNLGRVKEINARLRRNGIPIIRRDKWMPPDELKRTREKENFERIKKKVLKLFSADNALPYYLCKDISERISEDSSKVRGVLQKLARQRRPLIEIMDDTNPLLYSLVPRKQG